MGKYEGMAAAPKDPMRRAREAPKQIPGNTVGSITPKDIPTKAPSIASTHIATWANSIPTGSKRGSRNVDVTKPVTTAVSKPENRRGLLVLEGGVLRGMIEKSG
jgi:hypothetical protein